MIDTHSHIIPMVDDGSKNLNTTEKMLRVASENGFTGIFATPHFIDNRSVKREEMLGHFNKLKCFASSFGIELFLGNEVFICSDMIQLVKNGIVSSMNDSKYLLIELPRNNDINYLEDIIEDLVDNDIVPIIAHPERYIFVNRNPRKMYGLADKGALFQLNSGSLTGDYGDTVKNTAKKLLKYNMYQFMGTDAHSYDRYKVYNKATDMVRKICGIDTLKLITEINPNKVKNNEDIESDLQPMKKCFFFRR